MRALPVVHFNSMC